MTVKEAYMKLEGNYDESLSRLMKEDLVKKFALKFLDDKSFEDLTKALNEGRSEDAFRAAHTLKGVSANLAYTRLHNSAFEITELLRYDKFLDAKALYQKVKEDYELTINAIKEIEV